MLLLLQVLEGLFCEDETKHLDCGIVVFLKLEWTPSVDAVVAICL